MTPSELNASQFASYPPLAGRLGIQYLSLLQQLPLSFLPSLLRELIDYDYSFPVERSVMSSQLSTLAALTAPQLADWFRGFAAIRLNATLDRLDLGQSACPLHGRPIGIPLVHAPDGRLPRRPQSPTTIALKPLCPRLAQPKRDLVLRSSVRARLLTTSHSSQIYAGMALTSAT